ncbi:MAG TPA: Gfo/Idh/MocA family oxidoreductase [Tepidisphaeraceae bacterium]|nr:Gfo/Idh/MocA family oxidoreductase [Tepidisphaeraceae bacterium]
MDQPPDRHRRDFLKQATTVGVGMALAGVAKALPTDSSNHASESPPRAGASVAGLRAPKLDEVRVGMIGMGKRGLMDLNTLMLCPGVRINAVCDVVESFADKARAMVEKKQNHKPDTYTKGPEDYKNLCDRNDIDLVYIATPWNWHVPMCVDAMNKQKHAMTEVPAATTIDECWQLVDTAERTQKHCMILENCCYGPAELLVLNMVRQGLFGELLHGEGAYLHDLRHTFFSYAHEGLWRTAEHVRHNGNLYPTHGLGPIAQCMNINRGDRFDYLVSMSSPALSLHEYAVEHLPPTDPWTKAKFIDGDINTSIIKTAKGRTIMVQHDTSNGRPYSRIHCLLGTRALFRGYPDRIYVDGKSKPDQYESPDDYKQYVHPLWAKLQEAAIAAGGHGGMDYVLNWRLIDCLHKGLPLDIDVYDTAAWSSVTDVSEKSVAQGSAPVPFPDFTRGQWKTMKPLEIVS